jgi:integrase
MPKERTGTIWLDERTKTWRGRVSFTDPATRKRHERWVSAPTKTEARDKLKREIQKLDNKGPDKVLREKTTFRVLAEEYQAQKIVPAVIVEGQKLSGLKNTISPALWLKMLVDYFGDTPLAQLDPRTLENFKRYRLATPTQYDRQRKVATINRELQFLSRVLNYAVAHGYLDQNPFHAAGARGLIQRAKENRRARVLTFAEELALLDACKGGANEKRDHLRPILILLADTGLRRRELLTLEWRDVDLAAKRLTVRAENAKTNIARQVSLTPRALQCLEELRTVGKSLVFDGRRDYKRSFATACRLAKVPDFHGHDFRHTFVTRAIFAGIPEAVVLKVSGHTSDEWKRYLNITPDGLRALFKPREGQDEQQVKEFGLSVLKGLKEGMGFDWEKWLLSAQK